MSADRDMNCMSVSHCDSNPIDEGTAISEIVPWANTGPDGPMAKPIDLEGNAIHVPEIDNGVAHSYMVGGRRSPSLFLDKKVLTYSPAMSNPEIGKVMIASNGADHGELLSSLDNTSCPGPHIL